MEYLMSTPNVTNTKLTEFPPPLAFPTTLAPGNELLLTYPEVAQMLRMSESYLRAHAKELIPMIKLGYRVRFKLSDVLAYIEKNKLSPDGTPPAPTAAQETAATMAIMAARERETG
jgi:excisionase family DNA binding protein